MSEFSYLDNLFEPIAIINNSFELDYYNNYFATFFKMSPRQLKKIGSIEEILKFKEADIKDFINEAKTSKTSILSGELTLNLDETSDKFYTVVLKVVPVGKKQFMICLNDVSVETQLHNKYKTQMVELKSSHEQLLQTDKLATIGQLAAGISHEINNPLTVALGGAQNVEFFLTEKKLSVENINKSNQMIIDSLTKVADIISNMRSYVHKSENTKEYCDISELIASSIKLVQTGWAKENVEFVNLKPEEAKLCLINKIELEQVIINLLQNAVDALEESAVKKPKITISLSTNVDKNCIELFVKDNGPGIPKEIQEEIFEAFFTTKEVGKGTGLGMAISQKLINKYGGSLEIYESSSKGASFVVRLPLIEDSSMTHNSRLVDNLSNDTVKRILVVDDEPQILNIMENFIQEAGHLFIGSASGEEALKLLNEMDVEVIITDYHMPKMNGTEFAKKVREIDEEVPIIFLSGAGTLTEFQKDQKELKISGLIVKPFTKEDIFSMIDRFLTDEVDDEEA